MASSTTSTPCEGMTIEQRRAFLQLPLEERRRQMADQAERMLQHYETSEEKAEREVWQGRDIVDF